MTHHDYIKKMMRDSMSVKQKLLDSDAILDKVNEAAKACVSAYESGRKILIAGNGGSAGDAQHIAAELVARFEFDRPGLPAIALTTDTSMLTAIGNDYGYEFVFRRQVEANGVDGDVFIGISTSGNSKNVVAAMEVAKEMGLITVGLCGDGGKIKDLADINIAVPSAITARIQECHILIGHILCGVIEQTLFSRK